MARQISKHRYHGVKAGYRSGLEESTSKNLEQRGVNAEYEKHKIRYTIPAREATYTPDFVLPNGIIVETKGRFTPEDRKKHLLVKAQHPDKDIRILFQRSKSPIRKGSTTTYAIWCEKNGIEYADKVVPDEWLKGAKQ